MKKFYEMLQRERFNNLNPNVREGQLYWIALSKIDTPFASEITVYHHDVDPFYDDAKIPAFIEFISTKLGE
jgi:hypothetical protein